MHSLLSDYPPFLTANDLVEIMRIGRSSAYELMRTEQFPSIRIGKSVRVPKSAFIQWLERNQA